MYNARLTICFLLKRASSIRHPKCKKDLTPASVVTVSDWPRSVGFGSVWGKTAVSVLYVSVS